MTTAIVLICDRGYLVPTIGAALQARAHLPDPAVPVLVFLTEPDDALLATVGDAVAPHGVDLRAAELPGFEAVQVGALHRTHVTLATMARLWIDRMLPAEVTRFLYLDGDIDITAPLAPLLAMPVPPHGFLAAPDVNLLIEGEVGSRSRVARGYLSGLGLSRGADYFNAGVLLVDRAGWADVSAAALAFFAAHPERCPFHDQSALNAVSRGIRGELSPVWNWQTDFMAVVDPGRLGVVPAIWHFTGYPKPWQARFPPWADGFGSGFECGAALLAPLGIGAPPEDADAVAAGVRRYAEMHAKLHRRYPWRLLTRRRRIEAVLRRCAVRAAAPAPLRLQEETALADH
jgi:hypothetical protein